MHHDEILEVAEEARRRNESFEHTVRVCMAAGCQSSGSLPVKEALESELEARGQHECCRVLGRGAAWGCAPAVHW